MPPFPFDPTTALDLVPALARGTDRRIGLWTAAAERLYGWARQAALGQQAAILLGTEPDAPRDEIEAALQHDGVWQGSVRQRTADGRQLALAAYWAVQRDPTGAAVGVLEVATPLPTSSQATEAASRLAAIVDSSEEAIIGKDLLGRVTSWNRAAEQMLGYAAAEIIGQPIARVLPAELMAQEADVLDRIGRGLAVPRHESTRRRKDGTIVPVFLSISPVRDGSGRIVGSATIARDISGRIRDQEALRASQAELIHLSRLSELGQIASALAHEINQPLTAIGNYVSGARRLLEAGNTAGTATALARIGEQAERGAQIVLRLRDFMRKRDTEKRLEALPAVIEEACALAMIGVRDRPLRLVRRLDPAAACAVLDRVQIEQVLFNLLRNAIEATADAPRQELTVVTRRLDPEVVQIEVVDTGPGLPDSVRARLFQPFVTTKANGLGVGLSICRGIVQAHGGSLTAVDNPGGGTVFRFTLAAEPPVADGADR